MTAALAGDEVARAWLKSLTLLEGTDVGTSLPDPSRWSGDQFLQVTIVGGAPDPAVPLHKVLVQVDCYATRGGNSPKPAWDAAGALAGLVLLLTYDSGHCAVSTKDGYADVYVADVIARTEPRRQLAEAAALARYSVDLEIAYYDVEPAL